MIIVVEGGRRDDCNEKIVAGIVRGREGKVLVLVMINA